MARAQVSPADRPSSRSLALESGKVVHVGVDVHRHTYHVAVLGDVRGFVTTWVQPASPELLVRRLRPAWGGSPRSSTRPAPPASPWCAGSGPRGSPPR
jgi:hypothetical protein